MNEGESAPTARAAASWRARGRPFRGFAVGTFILGLLATAATLPGSARAGEATAPLAIKVLVVNMFGLEAAPWIAALAPDQQIRVPGLSQDYPQLQCNRQSVCQMTTGMGHANAAASMMAVLFSGQFDLRQTYFLIAGIAGIDPARGTIGSAAWAHYVVDTGLAHEIDAREMPRGWQAGYFGILTDGPGQVPKLDYRTEVFELDADLVREALRRSQSVVLEDSADVRRYRQHYGTQPANAPPRVIGCDTASGDTWWGGRFLGEHARRWTRLLTGGHGLYCTTQQEDNATLNALTRGAQAGLIDLKRVAVLRSGSDFDRPYPRQDTLASMQAQRALDGAVRIAADNLVRAGMPLIEAITHDWPEWQNGVPAADTR